MNGLRRLTSSLTLAALLVGLATAPVVAKDDGKIEGQVEGSAKVSGQFADMGDFAWGLSDVTKLTVKGVFKGRGEGHFAPGAQITLQEAAVAVVRLMDKEAAAKALTEAEVTAALSGVSDQSTLAVWARPSVAYLVKAGVVTATQPYKPLQSATRLDVAVMLVKALGFEAEAQAKMNAQLSFQDAGQVAANLKGYVSAAVDHQLVLGFPDNTFRPGQAVTRVEMAVMMGRADRLIDNNHETELRGTIKSVTAATGTLVVTAGDKEMTLKLAGNASIFIDGAEKALSSLQADMKVEVKLNGSGAVIFIEAKSPKNDDHGSEGAINGKITALTTATLMSFAVVKVDGTAYVLAPLANIKLEGQSGSFADLRVGDAVTMQIRYGVVTKIEVHRPGANLQGTIASVVMGSPNKVNLITTTGGTVTVQYNVAADAQIKLNGETATFANLKAGDKVEVMVSGNVIVKIIANRPIPQPEPNPNPNPQPGETVIIGTIVVKHAALPGTVGPGTILGTISVAYTQNGAIKVMTMNVTSTTKITVNGQVVTFGSIESSDAFKATFAGDMLMELKITR